MDLSSLDPRVVAEEGAVMELLHPVSRAPLVDDDKKPFFIRLCGADSETYKKAERVATNRRLAMQGKRRGNSTLTAEELDADAKATLAACAKEWHVKIDGQTPACTQQNVRAAFDRFEWMFEQADDFVGARSNFLKASSTTSAHSQSTNSA